MQNYVFFPDSQETQKSVPFGQCEMADRIPCLPCARYIELDVKLAPSRTFLDRLLALQSDNKADTRRLHAPVINRMPAEIVARIFSWCIADYWTEPWTDPIKRASFLNPLTLGAICWSWRQIAWSTPRLWTYIKCKFGPDEKPSSSHLEISREWLSRSGEMPLAISIKLGTQEHDANRDEYEFSEQMKQDFGPFIDIFNEYSHRWQCLSISCPPELLASFTGNPLGSPILEHIGVTPDDFDGNNFYDDEDNQFKLQAGPPQPTFAVILDLSLKTLVISYIHVTQVIARGLRELDCLELILLAPMLERLVLVDAWYSFKTNPNVVSESIIHDRLRDIEIRHQRDEPSQPFMRKLFKTLVVPNLKELCLKMLHGHLFCDSLIYLLDRSSCSLKTFIVNDAIYDDNSMIQLLQSRPSIENLELLPSNGCDHPPEEFLGLFARTKDGTDGTSLQLDFLPNLKRFKYSVSEPNQIPWQFLADIYGPPTIRQRRPLGELTMVYRERNLGHFMDIEKTLTHSDIGKNVLLRLLELEAANISLYLSKRIRRKDLLDLLQEELAVKCAVYE
ncbi:hypothetical protein CVT25_011868 [Psilocybe cyanescens]|uniref:F-box domain-containing protein n=1 Tax=Psilocybe cyanescens TaxID=93625 RepID=A0A409WIY2_PSICY|nr:hypothetical protein CVT25_011868 [Psilocybe cyanescens]